MSNNIYYLPGFGGRLETGLGTGLLSRGFSVVGRETSGNFGSLPFEDLVEAIADDLKTHFWRRNAHVVASSFGAYLFLQAQLLLPSFPGRVLLLSPIIGSFGGASRGRQFIPPRQNRLTSAVHEGNFQAPFSCEIHVGEDDWQSCPEAVTQFGNALSIFVTIVPGAGHMLGKEYVGRLLDQWIRIEHGTP